MSRMTFRTLKELRAAHDSVLPELSLKALRNGQPLIAFAAADRWLRIAGKNVASLMLRAEAYHRLGLTGPALADVADALERAPFHRHANRRLADWGAPAQARAAARTLIGFPGPDAERGLSLLREHEAKGAGQIRISDGVVEGWLSWSPGSKAELLLSGSESRAVPVLPQENCRWGAVFGAGAVIRHDARPETLVRAALVVDGEEVAAARGGAAALTAMHDDPDRARPDVTIIVPVYGDFESTRDCLVAAAAAIETVPDGRLLIVDDASPDARIKAFLDDFAKPPGRKLLVNPINLGFVGAVNRALRHTAAGDVLLLNADALLPLRSIERFREIARRRPDVGVINPLSNHGEFVSHPKPFRHNDFEPERWRRTDAAAAALADAPIVDIPSGTGFCMYVTRACLDATGRLSEQFAEGYLEDADFGLRAREAGFRNVCAPSIYVPHLGSRSFKGAKAALVARNRLALARRFPAYEAECDAFVRADPLRRSRERLEQALAAEAPIRRLIIGAEHCEPALRARAERLARENVGAFLGLVETGARGLRIRLTAFDGAAPQNVVLREDDGIDAMFCALRRWPSDRIELVVTPDIPPLLRDRLGAFAQPLDLVIAAAPASSWRPILAGADRAFGIDALSDAFCRKREAARLDAASLAATPSKLGPPALLTIVYPYQTADSLRLLLKLSAKARRSGLPMILLGSTPCDEKLRAEGIFVTGPAQPEERLRLIEIYGADRLLLPYRREAFWALAPLLEERHRAAAYFDWSETGFRLRDVDLALDAAASDEAAAQAIMTWIGVSQDSAPPSVLREVA
jgi:GT2 family glycosyltransferase